MKCVICEDDAFLIVNNTTICKHCFAWGVIKWTNKPLIITTKVIATKK